MGEREPRYRKRSDVAMAMAKFELQKFGIFPIDENIDTYFLYKETPQRPRGYDPVYNNLDNPEQLKKEMQKRELNTIIHTEGKDLRSHIALSLTTLENMDLPKKEKEFLKLVLFYHDLGKQEVFSTKENRIQTIKTTAKGRLFQTMERHAAAAGEKIEKGLKANGLKDNELALAQKLIANHMNINILARKDPVRIVKDFNQLGKDDAEMKRTIDLLIKVIQIDCLATKSIHLRENGDMEYLQNTQRANYSLDNAWTKYQNAIAPARKKEIENQIYEKRINNCERHLLLMAHHLIPLTEENTAFGNNPDDPNEHSPQRHQFGIITHSKKSVELFGRRQQYIKDKDLQQKIDDKLQETIDGKTKLELLATAFEFHDIGKFLRTMPVEEGKKQGVDPFKDHEIMGEKLILENKFVQDTINESYHLTPDQLNYVAKCIGLHYELSKARDKAKTLPGGYSLAYADSEYFTHKICKDIKNKNPDFQMEIGLLFLVDSLAKTGITIRGENDGQLMSKKAEAEQRLQEKNLPLQLIDSVMQKSVNVAVAKKYLESIFS